MGNASSSTKQMQIEFKPLVLNSEPIPVSNDSFTLSTLPQEILPKIGEFASVEAMRNLIATCKYIRNQLDTWFLQVLASENNPDRATSGFIVDAIGNKGDTRLRRNAKFFIKDHDVPKDLSIHMFTNATAEKISSNAVRSMIIQLSESLESHEDIHIFLKFLFFKVSFKSLKCLMLSGIELPIDFSQLIGDLKLDVFHMRNSHCHTDWARPDFFRYCNSMKTLYVVYPYHDERICLPNELKRLVIYCSKSSKDEINGIGVIYTGLLIDVGQCHALKEM